MWRASRVVTRAVPSGGGSKASVVCMKTQSPGSVFLFSRHESKSSSSESTESSGSMPPPPPRSGGGWFWKFLGLTVVGAGGVVGYAWYDPGFRKAIESSIPYSKETLDTVFQYLPSSPGETNEPPKPVKKPDVPSSAKTIPPKEPVPPSPAKASVSLSGSAAAPGGGSSTLNKESENSRAEREKREAEEGKRAEKERAEKALKEREEKEAQENKELEVMLERLQGDAQKSVSKAVNSLNAAADAVRNHSKQIKQAMEKSGSETQWVTAADTHQSRTDAVWTADTARDKAKAQLEKLRSKIADGKAGKATQKNRSLLLSEAELSRLNASLSAAQAELSKAESEAKVVAEYRELVKKGKEQFQKELESIMPEVKLGEKKGKLTEDELNALIAHAHRRIEQLQRQLAEHQAMEQQRIERSLDRQKEEDEKHASELVQLERERIKSEIDVLKQNWDAEARVEHEQELRAQLARQAAAHSDHIVEVLRVQQKELEARNELLTRERLDEQRDQFQKQVIDWVTRLHGIEAAVEARAELEKRGRKAQELWLACQTLASAVAHGNDTAVNWDDRLRPLEEEIRTVREAGSGNPYVTTVLASVPDVATHRGVWTETDLAERFFKVAEVGRKVAMIDEAGGSLFRYFLSYLQSRFMIRASRSISRDTLVTPSELSTFELLDNASACIERGDLDQAVRFVNQLQGEPRRVASDWLTEARLLLETRQAADALLAFATATGLSSLF